MPFWGKTFIFDEVPSEFYELYICEIGDSGVGSFTGSTSVEMYTSKVFRNPKVFLYGTEQTPALQFTIKFACTHIIDSTRQQAIQRWLFGHNTYKKLRIVQCDMQNVYFNCILTDPKLSTYGNLPYVFECTVICDAPWAWQEPITNNYGQFTYQKSIQFDNYQDDNYYMFPIIQFTLQANTYSFTITNNQDNGRSMSFTSLTPGETITVDCRLGIITQSTGLLRYDNFQGDMFRLAPGINNIIVSQNLDSFSITYQNAIKVGG